jgi:glycosyltransferase involved in cell wall biosynthesis
MSVVAVPRPRRVLHVIDSLRVGGAEVLLAGLVRELTRAGLARSAVCAFSGDEADPGLVDDVRRCAERLTLAPQSRLYDPRVVGAVFRAALSFEPDVVHSHLSGANVTSRLVATVLRRPHLVTIHTIPGPRSEDNPPRRIAEGLTARLSTLIAAPSSQVAAGYAAARRVPLERLRVVPNAPIATPPPPGFDRTALRTRLLDAGSGPLVVCVARLEPEKGIDDLVTAAALIRAKLPGLRVLVAGGGSDRRRLERRIEDARLGRTVELLGPRSDVGHLLAAADAFCLPSRYEGLPLSMLEALDAGLPCVVTAVGGVPDVVDDGQTALLVPPGQPRQLAARLERVLADPALAERLGRAGRDVVRERYSLPMIARRYADLYEELADGRRRHPARLATTARISSQSGHGSRADT